MGENKDWYPGWPGEQGPPCDEQIEYERLLGELKILRKNSKKADKENSDNAVNIAFDVLAKECEINDFYERHPDYDPRNERWSDEFREIDKLGLNPRYDWLKKSTWTVLEAINLCGGYRAERPAELITPSQRNKIRSLEVDLFVRIFPVPANVHFENILLYRVKPSEFVEWLECVFPGSVPSPVSELGRHKAGSVKEVSESGHKLAKAKKNSECIEAIQYVLEKYPEECKNNSGGWEATRVADKVDQHWYHISSTLNFRYSQYKISGIEARARKYIRENLSK